MRTSDLANKKVYIRRPNKHDPDFAKKAGRIRAIVFHPKRARVVGFLIKQPDIAWMFRRDDLFVAADGLEIVDDTLIIKDENGAKGRVAEKELAKNAGVGLDDCVIWIGLPVITECGSELGIVDGVDFDFATGEVNHIELSLGATANTLLGQRHIPVKYLRGLRRDDVALVVSDEAKAIEVEGGIAEKAGSASAIAADKAKRTYKKVVKQASAATEKAQPALRNVAKVANEAFSKITGETAEEAAQSPGERAQNAAEKGAFSVGRQISRAGGMFSGFKDEFTRALNEESQNDEPLKK